MEIPADIQNIIVRKLDIDTRRAIGCYTRLNVPNSLQEKLGVLHKKHRKMAESHLSCVGLGPKYSLWNGGGEEYLYNIIRLFRNDGTLHEERVDKVLVNNSEYFFESCTTFYQDYYNN